MFGIEWARAQNPTPTAFVRLRSFADLQTIVCKPFIDPKSGRSLRRCRTAIEHTRRCSILNVLVQPAEGVVLWRMTCRATAEATDSTFAAAWMLALSGVSSGSTVGQSNGEQEGPTWQPLSGKMGVIRPGGQVAWSRESHQVWGAVYANINEIIVKLCPRKPHAQYESGLMETGLW